jgi:xylan 1,4-beta-xylosidase
MILVNRNSYYLLKNMNQRIIQKLVIIILMVYLLGCSTQQAPSTYINPIIPGFYPDPSVVRVDDTYYLVTSSFEWFPGLPLHKSKDLVNWKPIGNVIDRKGMITENLNLWAPAIRYHDGLFYVICTERPGHIFFTTAINPEGPWSQPVYIDVCPETVSAIDPSLFWDEDGSCWLASNDRVKTKTMKHWIWISKIDLTPVERNGRLEATLVGERKYITTGSGIGPDNYTEAPHIHKYKGMYYLWVAEGGTWNNHAVSVLRTKNLDGPVEDWEYHPNNPILTHRDKQSPISATGHADLVQTQNGEWWSVHLGVRKRDGKHKLGRETFLVPVEWKKQDDGSYWPLYNPDKGNMTLMEDTRPNLPWTPVKGWPGRDEFKGEKLRPEWNFYMEPISFDWYKLGKDGLTMDLLPRKATDRGQFGFIGRRQQHHSFDAFTKLRFDPANENEVAGLMASIKHSHHIRLEVSRNADTSVATLYYVSDGKETIAETVELPNAKNTFYLKLEARDWDFQFLAGTEQDKLIPVGDIQDAKIMSSEVAKGFTGSYVGMYGSANGAQTDTKATFHWFEYLPKQ